MPAVAGMPACTTMSLSASGTPASGDAGVAPAALASSTARAWASADSVETCRNACTAPSTASIRSRCARVTSSALTSPLLIEAGECLGRHSGQLAAHCSSPRICGTRNRPSSTAGAPASAASWVRPGRTTSSR